MRAEVRAHMQYVEHLGIEQMQHWRMGCLFWHWHSHTQSCKAGRQRLQALHAHTQQRRYDLLNLSALALPILLVQPLHVTHQPRLGFCV